MTGTTSKNAVRAGDGPKEPGGRASRGKAVVASLRNSVICSAILLVCAALPAQAQFSFPVQPLGPILCVYSAVPVQVRAEDLAARSGDARLDCTNNGIYNPLLGEDNNMVQYVSTNVSITLNTAVSGINDGTSTGSVLVINSNDSFFPRSDSVFPQAETCGIEGTPPASVPDPRYPCPQKAVQSGPNTLTWSGVQFPVPGAPNSLATLPADTDADGFPDCVDIFDQTSTNSCFNTVTTVRITNIFANAAAVGAGGAIFGNLTIFPSSGISVYPSNQQTVANVFQGLTTDFDAPGAFQCIEGIRTLDVAIKEGFAGAFKLLGDPTLLQGDFTVESGYPLLEMAEGSPPQTVGGTGGGATQATRFMLRLRDVPDGVIPSVPNTVDEDASGVEGCPTDPMSPNFEDLCVQRVEGADQDGAGGAAGDGVGDYEIPLVDGVGQVIYEVKNGNPFAMQSLIISAQFTCMEGSPPTNLVASASFAPLSDDGEANPVGPVPRFIDSEDEFPTNQTDLRLSKTTTSYSVEPGVDTVEFNLSVTNFGPNDASNVELVDILPGGLTHVSNSLGCGVMSNIVTCNLGTIADNATVMVDITASVDPDAAGVLVNNASVMSDIPEPTPDPHPNMDSASVVVLADLTIISLTAPSIGELEGPLNVSVDVANTGFLPAGPFQLGFYFSTDSSITALDTPAALTCTFPTGLADGDTANCSGPITVPTGLVPATYFFGAIADFAHAVIESDENNNTRVADSGPLQIEAAACAPHVVLANQTLSGTQVIEATSTATLGPDLIIDGDNIVVRAPTVSILGGTSIGGTFSISNIPACP